MNAVVFQSVDRDAPWTWLAEGWRDMMRAPALSIGFGAVFVGAGLAMSAALWAAGWSAWIPALVSGFALVAPLCAVGFYRISRDLDAGRPVGLSSLIGRSGSKRTQIAFMGVLLFVLFLMWARLAQFIYAYFTIGYYAPLDDFTAFLLTDPAGLTLLIVGTLVGGALAVIAFSISVLSFPMMIDREVDAFTAMAASLRAVKERPFVMGVWAFLIALVTFAGAALFLVGLAVAFPWLGHASWRAYKSFSPRESA